MPDTKATQGTRIGKQYAMPHREKHGPSHTHSHRTREWTIMKGRGGSSHNRRLFLALLKSRMCDCTSVGKVTGSQALAKRWWMEVNGRQNPRAVVWWGWLDPRIRATLQSDFTTSNMHTAGREHAQSDCMTPPWSLWLNACRSLTLDKW